LSVVASIRTREGLVQSEDEIECGSVPLVKNLIINAVSGVREPSPGWG